MIMRHWSLSVLFLTVCVTELSAQKPSPTPAPTAAPLPTPDVSAITLPTPLPPLEITPMATPLPPNQPAPPPTDLPAKPSVSPTPSASPAASPAPSPLPGMSPVNLTLDPNAVPTPSVPVIPVPVTYSASDLTPAPSDTKLPDVLQDQPLIPQDLIAPMPKPGTYQDNSGSIKSSEQSLANLRAAAKRQPSTVPANAPKLTLNDAIQYALKHNPDVLNAIETIRLTRGQVITVAAQALPQLGINTTYSVQQQELAVTVPQNQSWDVQFGVTQLLFDGGNVISGIRAAKSIQDASYFQLRDTIDTLISNVKGNFFQVILNRALILAQEESVELLESQLQDQINRYEAGTVPRFNVLQAEVQLANAIPPLIDARNNLRISQYQLVQLLGMDYPAGQQDVVPFNVVGDLKPIIRKIDSEQSIRTALTRSPSLKAQRQEILAQAQNVNVAISGFMPRISANAGQLIQNDIASTELSDTVNGWFFGLQGSWAVFDGFQTVGEVMQAKSRLQSSKINYDNGVRQVIFNVQQAISNLQTSQETLASQQASVAQATEALRLSRERLDAGAGTQLDVLNAQVQLLQAQTTELQARYDYINFTAQYDAALSIDTKYLEQFDDPLTRYERRRFNIANKETAPQPPLPRVFRKNDPLEKALAAPTPAPSPAPSPVKKKN